MNHILVSGLINIETTVRVDGFPIEYCPVRYPFFGVASRVSGVGYNIAKALTTLGDRMRFLSLIGTDPAARLVLDALDADNIPSADVLPTLPETAQSAILYDGSGRRLINTDLKDIQERTYPVERFEAALSGCDLAVLCNINFSRPFLARARAAGIPIACDVHTISDLADPYNRDFMAAADLLFMSDERLPCPPDEWVRRLWDSVQAEIIVVGLGGQGALLGLRRESAIVHCEAVATRPVINTIGAGDALFSAFVHGWRTTRDARAALAQAVVFASYKIGTASAAAGFLDQAGLAAWCAQMAAEGHPRLTPR